MQKMTHHTLKLSQVLKERWKFSFFNIICFLGPKIQRRQHNKVKSVVGIKFSNATIYKWVKTEQLPDLNQRNE